MIQELRIIGAAGKRFTYSVEYFGIRTLLTGERKNYCEMVAGTGETRGKRKYY